jgi:tetratricopeptide (TPR) repeat protein
VGVTALIVARPFVLGEDPGLQKRPLSDSTGMLLGLLWLILAVGWAAWRVWSRRGDWYSSLVDVPLAALVGIVFLSSSWAAEYKHPAWLIAWEWLILLVLFVLVRQLARSPVERRGLLAAIVATGVSVSGQAVYQYAVVLPQQRALADNPEKLSQEAVRLGLQADDPNLKERLREPNVYATFAHPNSLAGYLALLLPPAVGWVIVCGRRNGLSWWTLAVVACALLIGTALWLTHSRGAILACLLVGVTVAVVRGHRAWWPYKAWVLAGTAGLVVVLVFAFQTGVGQTALDKARASFELRLGYWDATWRMIQEPERRFTEEAASKEKETDQGALGPRPAGGQKPERHISLYPRNWVLGVGPGGFGSHYLRYMAPTARETIKDPHNFVLEIWATSGVFALLALLVALALFFWRTRYAWFEPDPEPSAEPAGPLRWEFYVGGMVGLTLGFVLRVSGLGPDEILIEGLVTGVSCVLWFAAFGLLDNVAWEGPSQVLAMVAGVAALLLNLGVSGGIAYPSVAQPLWTVAALALADRAVLRPSQSWFAIVLPLPLVAVVSFFYFSAAFYPVASCSGSLAQARAAEAYWKDKVEPEWYAKLSQKALSPQEKLQATQGARAFVDDRIVKVLKEAAAADPTDAYPHLQLAVWQGREWQMLSLLREFGDNPRHSEVRRREVRTKQLELSKSALDEADEAWRLDPASLDGYRTVYALASQFADAPDLKESSEELSREEEEKNKQRRQLRRAQAATAAAAARLMLQRDPTETELHYRLADALFRAGATEAAKAEVARTRDLRESGAISQRNPTEARLHYRLADALFQVGNLPEAVYQESEGRQKPPRDPPDPQLHYRLAEAFFKINLLGVGAGTAGLGGAPFGPGSLLAASVLFPGTAVSAEVRFHATEALDSNLHAVDEPDKLKHSQEEDLDEWLGRPHKH